MRDPEPCNSDVVLDDDEPFQVAFMANYLSGKQLAPCITQVTSRSRDRISSSNHVC